MAKASNESIRIWPENSGLDKSDSEFEAFQQVDKKKSDKSESGLMEKMRRKMGVRRAMLFIDRIMIFFTRREIRASRDASRLEVVNGTGTAHSSENTQNTHIDQGRLAQLIHSLDEAHTSYSTSKISHDIQIKSAYLAAEKEQNARESREYWELQQVKESERLQEVESLLEKRILSNDEMQCVTDWLAEHSEFGLSQMSDQEFLSNFSNGKFYIHSTSFFGNAGISDASTDRSPRFVEALKDGYLVGKKIGIVRGEEMSGDNWSESLVCFDSEEHPYDHVGYSFGYTHDIANNPPVLLISPARILESHSVKKDLLTNKPTYTAEGVMFGSSEPNPNALSHEINLECFVVLLPKIRVRQSLARDIISDFIRDERYAGTQIPRIAQKALELIQKKEDEMSKIEKQYGWRSSEAKKFRAAHPSDFDLESFMRDIFSRAAAVADGVRLPRLHFYNVTDSSDVPNSLIPGIERFLESEVRLNRDKNPTMPERSQTPEAYRVNRDRMEAVANRARKLLTSRGVITFNATGESAPLSTDD